MIQEYEVHNIGDRLVEGFLDGKMTDMECLAACRKLKSIYDLINRKVKP